MGKVDGGRDRMLNIRLTAEEMRLIKQLAEKYGHGNVSSLVRGWLAQNNEDDSPKKAQKKPAVEAPKRFWGSDLGRMYHGDSRGLLRTTLRKETVDLVVTSPPFGLVRKKAYGNEPSHKYLEWFKPFAEGIKRVLKPTGSLVIDIGPAWLPGLPPKSLYQFELLTMLCEEYGFFLAQDFYWWNPARMPAPAEWVNVRRLRVKDAVNPVWWLSPTPWPKASNRRVLTPYGKSQKELFKRGYNAGPRPSGHVVSESWGRDNGGAIPPNLIAAPNTVSDDPYQKFCRDMNMKPHPARFPWSLPEFFIRMLTDRGDLVVDPFAGSCITGAVAESLGRKWVCGELIEDYLLGALGRFQSGDLTSVAPSVPEGGYNVPISIPAQQSQDGIAIDSYGGKAPPKEPGRKGKKATVEH